jgi:hypothetical protein
MFTLFFRIWLCLTCWVSLPLHKLDNFSESKDSGHCFKAPDKYWVLLTKETWFLFCIFRFVRLLFLFFFFLSTKGFHRINLQVIIWFWILGHRCATKAVWISLSFNFYRSSLIWTLNSTFFCKGQNFLAYFILAWWLLLLCLP